MKKCFHKISAFVMAIVVLLSTLSFTVNNHYCGDYLVDSSVFVNADSCKMKMQKAVASSSDACSIEKKSCCSDKVKFTEGQNDLSNSDITEIDHEFVALLIFNNQDVVYNKHLETFFIPFEKYVPPLIIQDIQLLEETFLI